jgi:ABC-type sugar transport system permease subunit
MVSPTPVPTVRGRSLKIQQQRRTILGAAGFLAPKTLLFAAFVVIPFLYTFTLMFQMGSILGGFHFVGLYNFETLLTDGLFLQTLEHTGLFMAVTIPVVFVCSIAMGSLFTSQIRGMAAYRTMIYIPSLLSIVTSSLIWRVMLDPNVGLIYHLFNIWLNLGIPWLSVGWVAIFVISGITAWSSLGFYSIMVMAGLNALPETLFEAARIDGASPWNVFLRIKLPLLRPVLQLMLVLLFINSIQVFDIIYVMTDGGPGTSTYTVMWYIYENVFNGGSVGYAAAMGVLMLIFTLVISGLIIRSMRDSV